MHLTSSTLEFALLASLPSSVLYLSLVVRRLWGANSPISFTITALWVLPLGLALLEFLGLYQGPTAQLWAMLATTLLASLVVFPWFRTIMLAQEGVPAVLVFLWLVWALLPQVATLPATLLLLDLAIVSMLVCLLSTTQVCKVQNSLTAILSYFWLIGFSTMALLWCVSFSFGDLLSLDLWSLRRQAVVGLGHAVTLLLGYALLIKLTLVPLQFFLLSFYRSLELGQLAAYLACYYVPSVLPVVLTLLVPLLSLLGTWHLCLGAMLAVLPMYLFTRVDSISDVRTMLAYSTTVNLSLILLLLTLG